jgi:rhamnulokinase
VSGGSLYVAIDLGAGSGRIFTGALGAGGLELDQVARFRYPAREVDGHLRWDFAAILREIRAGLGAAAERARATGREVVSVGVDSWGVDYGLVDRDGRLLEDPISYRDERTEGIMPRVFARVPREEIFVRTGSQFLPINTLFQLAAHVEQGLPASAHRLLMIPDLVTAALAGREVTEFTNATTTQMVHVETRRWDTPLLDRLGLPSALCGEIVEAGTGVGHLLEGADDDHGLAGVSLTAVATHDTGSAVAGTPLDDGWAYISSGTWSLVGLEIQRPLVTPDVARANVTNEGGAYGTTRFLKNVMGLWILESCRREWEDAGLDVRHDRLLEQVALVDATPAVIYPDDPHLLHPHSMLAALGNQLHATGQTVPDTPAELARAVLDSLALRYASVLRDLARLTNTVIRGVRIVGGGSQNGYLNQATATTTGLPVAAGPVEATVAGNVLVQAVASGEMPSLALARRRVAEGLPRRVVMPRPDVTWKRAAARYAEIEARFALP